MFLRNVYIYLPAGRFTPGQRASGTHWIGGWVGPRASLDDVEKRKISFSYRESNSGRPARSQLLYLLSYPGSSKKTKEE
jgi:hypothetical protein